MSDRARQTEVMTAIAYPSSLLGVPQTTFIAMFALGILIGWIANFWLQNTLSIFISSPLILYLWIYTARKYARNPHIENHWRTIAKIRLAAWQRPRVSGFPGRRLIPSPRPCQPGNASWGRFKGRANA